MFYLDPYNGPTFEKEQTKWDRGAAYFVGARSDFFRFIILLNLNIVFVILLQNTLPCRLNYCQRFPPLVQDFKHCCEFCAELSAERELLKHAGWDCS